MTLEHGWTKAWYSLVVAALLAANLFVGTTAASPLSGQEPDEEWEINFSGNGIKIFDIYETDEGYTLIGTKNKKQAYLVRTDAAGNVVWEKVLDLRTSDHHQVIITAAYYTDEGGYLLGGTVPGYESYYYIARTDEDGVVVWDKEKFNQDYVEFEDLRETKDGGMIYSYNSGQSTSYIVKLDATGAHQWQNELTMTKYDPHVAIESIHQTADGGYIAGAFRSGAYILWKLNASGQSEWINSHGDGIGWVVPTSNNGFAIINYDRWLNRSVLFVTNHNGQSYLSKDLGINGTARSIELSPEGGYLIGLSNAVIACDAQGNVLWSKPVSQLTKALPTRDGGVVYLTSYEKVIKLAAESAH
ncbi:hypothetical protein ACE3MQ_00285 [Paenibacillus lentus]|uniref:hypothetical protein n=1 Tax=Paenibacillus lentus TaxID=1338368 RepID=UPI0036608525